jgi:hypothetical protein
VFEAGVAILLTAPSCGPATAKRMRGKGAEGPHRPGAMGLALGGREAASLAARPAQAATPCPLLPCGGGDFQRLVCERSVRRCERSRAGPVAISKSGVQSVREKGMRGALQMATRAGRLSGEVEVTTKVHLQRNRRLVGHRNVP